MEPARHIYEQWHQAAKNRDTAALIALYADDAELESPLVPVILGRDSGVLRGRAEILAFLEEGSLVWEYPRQTPDGSQVDILELMELDDDGKIRRHRIYWGWFGTQMLIASALAKA